MDSKRLKGIIPAMVTPFKSETQELDVHGVKEMVNWLIEQGVHGLFIAGTNGEAHLMSHDEIVSLSEIVVSEVAGKIPVISGAGRNSTNETIELAKELHEVNVDYISLVSPSYLVPNQDDLYKHYKKIATEVPAKFILYNIPSQTGLNISPSVVEKLSRIKNIVGIKDSGGDLKTQIEYVNLTQDRNFSVLNGSDSLILDTLMNGATGSVAATANVIPKIEIALYEYFINGDLDSAKHQRKKMDFLRMNLKKAVAPSVMKKTLEMMNLSAGVPRMPISEIKSNEIQNDLKNMIQYYEELNWE